MKISICPYCEKRFYTDYGNGGYIDHVMNFSQHASSSIASGDRYLVREITMDGNDKRSDWDIRERLECFKHWWVSEEVKGRVIPEVEKIISESKNARKAIDKAIGTLTPDQKRELRRLIDVEGYLR